MGKLINVNFGFKPSSPEIAGADGELRPELLARVYEIRVAAEGVRAVKAHDPNAVEPATVSIAPVVEIRPAPTNPLFEQAHTAEQPTNNVIDLDTTRQAVADAYPKKAV